MTDRVGADPRNDSSVRRRAVVRGAAWASPVIIAAVAAAPRAFAGSPSANYTIGGSVLVPVTTRSSDCRRTVGWQANGPAITITPTVSSDVISEASLTVWIGSPNAAGLTWSGTAGGWTGPVSVGPSSIGGVTAYGYRFTAGPVTAVDGTTPVPGMPSFVSSGFTETTSFRIWTERSVTINGSTITTLSPRAEVRACTPNPHAAPRGAAVDEGQAEGETAGETEPVSTETTTETSTL